MSILTSKAPSFVCIDGEKFEINTDFKVYLSLESIIFDNSISVYRRTAKILALCYKKLPSSLDGALEKCLQQVLLWEIFLRSYAISWPDAADGSDVPAISSFR